MYLSAPFTAPFNMTGQPGMSASRPARRRDAVRAPGRGAAATTTTSASRPARSLEADPPLAQVRPRLLTT